MMKLAYRLGCLEALIKLGATVLQKELSPAAKAYMQRLTGFDAPTATLDPTTAKAQREWRHVAQTKVPELIGASEDYVRPLKDRRPGESLLTSEGVRKHKAQGRILDEWIKSKGQQVTHAPGAQASAPAAASTVATRAEPLASAGQKARGAAGLGTAETAYNIVARKPRPGIQFAKTLARRFAHI
jgi:hypothetical protein